MQLRLVQNEGFRECWQGLHGIWVLRMILCNIWVWPKIWKKMKKWELGIWKRWMEMIESEKTHFTKVYSFSRLWYGHQELLVQMNREERGGGGVKEKVGELVCFGQESSSASSASSARPPRPPRTGEAWVKLSSGRERGEEGVGVGRRAEGGGEGIHPLRAGRAREGGRRE